MKNTKYSQTLTEKNLKITRARVAILDILENQPSPLDVGEITEEFVKRKLKTDTATVYRILEIFYKNRLVDRLEFQEGKFRYEILKDEHHHVICENCGKIEDVRDCPIGELETTINQKNKYKIKRHVLEFYGLCLRCQ